MLKLGDYCLPKEFDLLCLFAKRQLIMYKIKKKLALCLPYMRVVFLILNIDAENPSKVEIPEAVNDH